MNNNNNELLTPPKGIAFDLAIATDAHNLAHSGEVRQGERDRNPGLKLADAKVLPDVTIFEHINFQGASYRTSLNVTYVGGAWNDRISSIIVHSGTWRFYEHIHFGGRYWDFKEGYYSSVPNDVISSFQVIAFGR